MTKCVLENFVITTVIFRSGPGCLIVRIKITGRVERLFLSVCTMLQFAFRDLYGKPFVTEFYFCADV